MELEGMLLVLWVQLPSSSADMPIFLSGSFSTAVGLMDMLFIYTDAYGSRAGSTERRGTKTDRLRE